LRVREEQKRYEQEIEQLVDKEAKLVEEAKVPLPVAELVRLNSGRHYGRGLLSSLSELYKMVRAEKLTCIQCKSSKTRVFTSPTSLPDYQTKKGGGPCFYNFDTHGCEGLVISEPIFVNAVSIEIRDNDSMNDLDILKVILFENDTRGISVGEIVTVNGDIRIQQNNSKGKGKAFPVMYCQSIKYENRDQLELTVLDIQAILRFKDRFSGPELIKRLVRMTANRVIGCEVMKEGILMAAANAKEDNTLIH